MTSRRLRALTAVAAAALACLLPTAALAAGGPDVTGTVTADGAPVADANVTVVIAGNDMVWPTVTNANGAWSVTTGVQAGQTLTISATGKTTQSSPDARGCTTSTTPTGRVEVVVEALPLDPVTVVLDSSISSTTCEATATPDSVPTLPATDATSGTATGEVGGTLVLTVALAVVVLLAAWSAVRPPARRS